MIWNTLVKRALLGGFIAIAHMSGVAGIGEAKEAFRSKNYELALTEALPLARTGNVSAQALLGAIYVRRTKLRPRDISAAAYWYEKAAARGNADAQRGLASLYASEFVPSSVLLQPGWAIELTQRARLGGLWPEGIKEQSDQEAVMLYRQAALSRDDEAAYQLGFMYEQGQGVPKSPMEALVWFRKAAQSGDALQQFRLGRHLLNSESSKDRAEAAVWLQRAAEKGNGEAQKSLIRYYFDKGRGLIDERITQWTKQLAETGDVRSQIVMARSYLVGVNMPADPARAAFWYQKVVDQITDSYSSDEFFEEASQTLAGLYEAGNGVPKSESQAAYYAARAFAANKKFPEAIKMLMQSAELGDQRAQGFIGDAYRSGARGLPSQSDQQAAVWYEKAANQGHVDSQLTLGQMHSLSYSKNSDLPADWSRKDKSVYWYQKAAIAGNRTAQKSLADLLSTGVSGVPKDEVAAAAWYQKAAAQGSQSAAFELARMYEAGQGVQRDATLAAEWYIKAAPHFVESGDDMSQIMNLAHIFENGLGVQKDEALAVSLYASVAQLVPGFVQMISTLGAGDERIGLTKRTARGHLVRLLQTGRGIPQDPVFAGFLYYAIAESAESMMPAQSAAFNREAAERGIPDAQAKLGSLYLSGYGVEKDFAKAVYWLEKPAARGDKNSMLTLARAHEVGGPGLPRNASKASGWYQRAAAPVKTT